MHNQRPYLALKPTKRRPAPRANFRRARTVAAWVLLFGSIIGWPLSALLWARDEPQFVLGLSFLAIIIESASLLTASQVREQQADQ